MTLEIFCKDYLTWIIAIVNIYYVWAVAKLKLHGWVMAFLTQLLWGIYIYGTGSWGLTPISIVLGGLSIKNYCDWKRNPPKVEE